MHHLIPSGFHRRPYYDTSAIPSRRRCCNRCSCRRPNSQLRLRHLSPTSRSRHHRRLFPRGSRNLALHHSVRRLLPPPHGLWMAGTRKATLVDDACESPMKCFVKPHCGEANSTIQVGPFGQTSSALQVLGTAALTKMDFAGYHKGTFLQASAAPGVNSASIVFALLLLGHDFFWIICCLIGVLEGVFRRQIGYNLTWWSTIFPVGKSSLPTFQSPHLPLLSLPNHQQS